MARGGRGDFVGEVVRVTETGEVGLRWIELDNAVFLAMTEATAPPAG